MKKFPVRRFVVMLAGLLLMSLGITLFKLSNTGNDPCNAFALAFSDRFLIPFSIVGLAANILYFLFEGLLGRKYIGIGTFANWFCISPVAGLLMQVLGSALPAADTLPVMLLYMILGILVLSLSVSMYQSADLGIAPYDSIAMIIRDRTPIPYFFARVMLDGLFALLAFLIGGFSHIGLGTLVCAFGLGPFITFFDSHATCYMLKSRED